MTKNNIKHQVSQKQIERFLVINKELGEMTAYAEGKFYHQFNDLSLMHIHVIKIIDYHHPCTMSQIAKSANITLGSVTQIIDKLITKKYVTRKNAAHDRRIIYATLTNKGKNVIKAWTQHVALVAKDILSKLTKDEQETILTYMEKML